MLSHSLGSWKLPFHRIWYLSNPTSHLILSPLSSPFLPFPFSPLWYAHEVQSKSQNSRKSSNVLNVDITICMVLYGYLHHVRRLSGRGEERRVARERWGGGEMEGRKAYIYPEQNETEFLVLTTMYSTFNCLNLRLMFVYNFPRIFSASVRDLAVMKISICTWSQINKGVVKRGKREKISDFDDSNRSSTASLKLCERSVSID